MPFRNTSSQWGSLAKLFHWLIALLIVAAWIAFEIHDAMPKDDPARGQWLAIHKALGVTVFVLAWLRLGWRLSSVVPEGFVVAAWQQKLADAVHWLLYLVMICMPASGFLFSEYGDHPVSWFGLFQLPMLVTPDKGLSHVFHILHTDVFWLSLLALLAAHVGAALWHHVVVKDATLKRMLPWGRE